jgi:hypothetical protein
LLDHRSHNDFGFHQVINTLKMIKIIKKYALLAALLSGTVLSYAGSGKAIVPSLNYYRGSSTQFSYNLISITNITDHPIEVTVTCYDSAGSLLPSSWVIFNNFTSSNTQIAAKSTAHINVLPPTSTTVGDSYGYATVEWSNLSGSNDAIALIAHGVGGYLYAGANRESKWAIPINNGMPF